MRIESLKRWHWCIIGILVGAVVAAVNLKIGPGEPRGMETVGPLVLEEQLLHRIDPSKRVVYAVENLRIHPPTEMPLPGESRGQAEFLSYDVLLVRKDNKKQAERYPRSMVMEQRTPKAKSVVGSLDGLSIREYLDKLNAHIETLDKSKFSWLGKLNYRFAWIETPKGAYSVYTLGGLVAIGLIWPSIVQFLIGAGFGRAKEVDEADLSRYKSRKEPQKTKAGVTQADMDHLAELEAELEAKLKSGDIADAPSKTASPPKPAPVPVLNAGPTEAPKQELKQAAKPKGFGADQGDYYPTEVHGKNKS
jgi:hypothetical protein